MPENLYNSYSLEKTNGEISGSLTIWQDNPTSPYDIGDTFRPIPDGPLFTVNRVNITDNVIGQKNGKPLRQWQVTIEGSTEEQASDISGNADIKYTFNLSSDETSGSMEVTNKGENPILKLNVGSVFNIPGIGEVNCTDIKGSDSYNENGVRVWTVTYEGIAGATGGGSSSLPENEITTSYEVNGTTVRTVDGEFLALRRSSTPITKKSITIYNKSANAITTIGSTYEGGIALSENIVKETIKNNGVIKASYYKHTIEVEA